MIAAETGLVADTVDVGAPFLGRSSYHHINVRTNLSGNF
jgi:hypothetical protein